MAVFDRRDQGVVHAEGRAELEFLAGFVEFVDRAGVGARETNRIGDDRVEHGLEIETGVDGLADFAERAQLADRLGKLGGAGAQLVQQSDVLDGDHGLTGEARHQRDLLVGEGANFLPVNPDRTDEFLFLEHRYDQKGPGVCEFSEASLCRLRLRHDVDDVNYLLCPSNAAKTLIWIRMNDWLAGPKFGIGGGGGVKGNVTDPAIFVER